MKSIRAEGLRVRLGDREVLAGVDLEIAAGTVTLLAGRNGAGKTTLLRALAGLIAAERGQVLADGQPIADLRPKQRARRVAFVPQEADSAFEFTGRELVRMGRHPHLGRFQGLGAGDEAAVDAALRAVDAVPFADRPVVTLSGGELRRIAVARALCTEAPALLLDEPTANLDLEHALAFARLFADLARAGRAIVIASHDLNLMAPHADRVALLHRGRVRAWGDPAAVLDAATVAEVFGVVSADPAGYFPRDFRERG